MFLIVCCVCLVNFFNVVDKLVFGLIVWEFWFGVFLVFEILLFFFFFDVNDGKLLFSFCIVIGFVLVFDLEGFDCDVGVLLEDLNNV